MLSCSITYYPSEGIYLVRVRDDEGNLLRTEEFHSEAAAERWAVAVQRGDIVLDFG